MSKTIDLGKEKNILRNPSQRVPIIRLTQLVKQKRQRKLPLF